MKTLKTAHGQVNVSDNPEQVCQSLAQEISRIACQSVAERGRFSIALSGGSTPKALYALLAEEPYRSSMPWDKTYLFWGDERCVPHTSAESNFKMVQDTLIGKLNEGQIRLPDINVHATIGQELKPEVAAAEYEKQLQQFFALSDAGELPRFDLILLGLGPEGHTASMFPGSLALADQSHIVMAVFVEKLNSWRLTLTLRAINQAENVIFLVAGQSKAEIIEQIMAAAQSTGVSVQADRDNSAGGPLAQLPAQQIRPSSGKLQWFMDEAAASKLKALT